MGPMTPTARHLVWISAGWVAAAVLLRPFQNTPFLDDWIYAWAVERLLDRGDLRMLDYASVVNPVQTLWGALFCLPFGFSFTTLRVSTWVAALSGLWAMYLVLRDQDVSPGDALLGTACLGACPIYFMLSFSFMTDVPLVVSSLWAAFAFLRATSLRRDRWLGTAILASCCAVGVRVVG